MYWTKLPWSHAKTYQIVSTMLFSLFLSLHTAVVPDEFSKGVQFHYEFAAETRYFQHCSPSRPPQVRVSPCELPWKGRQGNNHSDFSAIPRRHITRRPHPLPFSTRLQKTE
ncbi:hypothetical protein DFH29DRAFT_969029 [Suillus ampliporus]|nr:hypothetical protein DFH29DRAFT_969029 [Suillus ampliporus]